ncbi:MAG: MFS transporter [Endomicrobium sp.]|jgi:OPA family glycerol-3-phosphate transporter-like MFS transporter/OPA family sugar phosphate sensor protein UhpC-like MFS transporter|nr:MFS transporter [Endomicrobium sp.]
MFSSPVTPEIVRKFKYWQIRTLLATWVAYAVFFIMRKSISMAMPGMQADLGISKSQLGVFLTLHGVVYGLSRFVNGFIVHKFIARNFIVSGLILCAITNFIFGFSSTVLVMGIIWLFHGWFQGMGWPPNARLLPHWIPPQELATKMSRWNTSHCVGAVAILIAGGYLASLGWRAVFFIPAIIAVLTAVALWFLIKDTPSSVGLPELSAGENYKKSNDVKENSVEYNKFIKKQVFKNPYVWIIAISNLFVYVLRFAILDWGPTILKEWKGVALAKAGWIIAAFEISGAIGIIICGWVTDKYFSGKGARVCTITLLLASLFMFLFWYTIDSTILVSLFMLVAAGFCIYGTQSLILVAVSNIATKRAAAVANGLVGIWGYGATIITGILLGFMTDKFGWKISFGFLIILGVVGVVLLSFAWQAKATGYDELDKI